MNTTITIRVDKELKDEASSLFSELGLDMTTACTLFLKKAVAENGIPFKVSKATPKETFQAIEDAYLMRNLNGPFSSMEELKDALNA